MKYYFLAGFLPEIGPEDAKLRLKLAELLEEPHLFAPGDWRDLELMLLAGDLVTIERLLKGAPAPVSYQLYPADFWREQIKSAQEGPEFIREFLGEQGGAALSPARLDALWAGYYRHVEDQARAPFLKGYFAFERDLRNVAAALRARRQKRPPAECLVGEGEVAEALAASSAEDFGLSRDLPWLERLREASTPQAVQEVIERVTWEYLEANAGDDPFAFSAIMAYLLKLLLLERRLTLNPEQGVETIRGLERA